MKVLHLISGGEVGGSKLHLLTLVKNMQGSDVKSIIVCLMEGALYKEAKELGLDIRLLRQKKRYDMGIVGSLSKLCKDEEIDIVNCHGGRANFIGYFLRKKYRAKYVTTVHSDYRDDYRGNTYKTLVFSNINRFVLKSFDYYITVSENFRDMLVSRGFNREKIFIVYNGIDFNRKRGVFSKSEIISKYNLKEAGHYVSMVARFHPVKGHRVFLDACKKVLEGFKDVIFILVGDGSLMEEYKKYSEELGISGNVNFVGFKPGDEFFYLSDFTVLTSYTESFPLVILESAYYEKTVVSTNVGGIYKLIEDGVNGYLIEPGDSIALSNRMKLLLMDKHKTEDFGKKLYLRAKDNYSIENLVEKYVEIYGRINSGGVYDE